AHDTASQALTGVAEAGATVTIFDGATQLGTASANSSGQWTYILGQLADGSHSLTATATDVAGNTGAASSALQFTVNTQPAAPPAPPTPVPTPVPPTSAAPTVPHVDDVTTTWGKYLALTGSAAAGATVQIYDSGALVGTVTADSSGDWSLNTRVGNGTHS